MKKILKPFAVVGTFLVASGIMASLISLTSCSKYIPNVVKLNNIFTKTKKTLQNEYGLPKLQKDGSIDFEGKKIIENANNALFVLNKFKEKNYQFLSLNEKIWLDSYIYNWKTEINNWNNGLQYLGGNPSGDALPINPNSNHLDNTINTNLNIFKIDPDTLEPMKDIDHVDNQLAKKYVEVGRNLSNYITTLKLLLKKGQELGVMENNISKKLFINQMLTNYYKNELLYWLSIDNNQNGVDIKLPTAKNNSNSLLINFDLWSEWASKSGFSKEKIIECENNLKDAQSKLDDFINWYVSDYFVSKNSYGYVDKINPLKVSKKDILKEVEKTILINNGKEIIPVYGLGVTNDELNLKNVGFGYMNSTLKINDKVIDGNSIYQALLQFNNSVNKTPQELAKIGFNNTRDSINKMKEVGRQIAILNQKGWDDVGKWKPSFFYRADIQSDEKAKEVKDLVVFDQKQSKETQLNWENFNKWLNQEDFFFGREIKNQFWDTKDPSSGKTMLDVYTSKKSGESYNKYLTILEKLGYAGDKGAWQTNFKKPINNINGNVDGGHALAGAVLSLFDYNNYKEKTKALYTRSFKSVPDYNVAPYNIKIESIIGVGLEGPRGSNIFNYNVNPYYSLPKWSISSFQDHEGSMGHHLQQSYWTKYMEGGDGASGLTPGYTFKLDAYHEGWAVFTEWFTAELGVYGTWSNETKGGADVLPTDWLHARGFVPSIKDENNPSEQEIKEIKEFQAGVYWDAASGSITKKSKLDNGLSDDQIHAISAVKIANMLQYYGFKNEAQLRNMRLVVDPAYHHKPINKETIDDGKQINYGASINDVRNYLHANSGLGQGDIKSESYRYLCMPAQSTGYMTGKAILEQCYKAVKKQYTDSHPGKLFVNDIKEIQHFFDLILRNGEIPLDVVQNVIKEQYHINFDNLNFKN